jgi:hypothetical protein
MHSLLGNPYFEFGPRPFRAARLRSYIVRRHRAGHALAEILADPYVARCGSRTFCWSVLEDPRTLAALGENDRERIAQLSHELGELRLGERARRG